ncbi:MAG: hypothetical protein L6Q47_04855 [Ignavibacteriaceae bacterium]|nr:hypothetical protein [Ignavibacteriaceae bacterium]
MYKSFVLLAVLLPAVFFAGCKEQTTEPTREQTNTLLPLALGNSWKYKLYNQSSDSTGQVVWTVDKKIIVDSLEYFFIRTTGFTNNSYVARIESDGLFLSAYDSLNGFSFPFFFKYPADDNETYQYKMIGSDSILNITVKKQNLLIGNQNYSCYGYINQNLNPYFPFMYFSENIGLIRHKLVWYVGGRIDTTYHFIYDLESKTINN